MHSPDAADDVAPSPHSSSLDELFEERTPQGSHGLDVAPTTATPPVQSASPTRQSMADDRQGSLNSATSIGERGGEGQRPVGVAHDAKAQSKPPNSTHAATLPVRTRTTSADKVLLEQYINRESMHDALLAFENPHDTILRQKRAERDYLASIHQERQVNPAAIFGPGYEGYGNARTDIGNQLPRLLYPAQRRRPGGRKSKELQLPKAEVLVQADEVETLVPIRLEVDWDKIKLRDTFTWNLHDRLTPPELFAEKLVEDLGLQIDACKPLIRRIKQSIEEQLIDYYPHVFMLDEAPLDPHAPFTANKNEEMRVLIKLNITIGQHTLVDQFEWDINDPLNSPEEFAKHMTIDLALPGEFTTAIAHSIREQTHLFTRSLYITSHPFDGRPIEDPDLKASFQPSPLPSPFRPYQLAKDFTPYLYELNETELERTETNISREQRRQKRSTNRRGGPALPDLKERQRTIRTLIVSSVIPGAAPSIEENRMFRRSGAKRGRRAAARDFGDSESESDSDVSSAGSPALSHLVSQTPSTTATRRSVRGAASAAQAKMHSLVARQGSPDTVSSVTHHETRGRRRDYREDSSTSESPERLLVTLKIDKDRLKRFLRDRGRHSRGGPPGLTDISASPAMPSSAAFSPTSSSHPASTSQTPTGKKPQLNLADAVEASHPPQPGVPPPSPPTWLVAAVDQLSQRYPHDAIEVVMRYSAVDLETGVTTMNPSAVPPDRKVKWYYIPRIRCRDCIGKLYTPGPGHTLDNFEVHVKMKSHREKVNARRAREAVGRPV
ncbi:SWI/SNF chromatin-remodeling complex subunit [Ascosphaera acerosa]|nr:SWI/SNF chromatin-remodeling complex subunit [Ascosphaera acerosa]